jgi:hypothetical protein
VTQVREAKKTPATTVLVAIVSIMCALVLVRANQARAAQPICTNVATSFSPSNPVSAGTTEDVTGTVTQAPAVNGCAGGSAGTPVTVGSEP